MTTNPRFIAICIGCFLFSAFMTYTVRNAHHSGHWLPPSRHSRRPGQHVLVPPKVAYATFLEAMPDEKDDTPILNDGPYQSTRLLAYQILHSRTMTNRTSDTSAPIPFLVLCTRSLSKAKRTQLKEDGATVLLVEPLPKHAMQPNVEPGREQLAMLRLFQLEQYTKILYLSPSTLVIKSLEGIFYDEATLMQTTGANPKEVYADQEAELPRTYMLGAHSSTGSYAHDYPPNYSENSQKFESTFLIFTPGKAMFEYCLSLVKRVNGGNVMPLQDLLNHGFRRGGNMPWRPLWSGWNVDWPTAEDWRGGAHSFSARFWDKSDRTHDPLLMGIWKEQMAEMEGYYHGREEGRAEH
ncbi:hypothetical protein LTR62_003759 [Meristemomyces frigidus]|uniref:Glycosyltransferase family 8 protein n=1 Tax=Meristemomyces frigidus TaxID=1508187 RepID=A0AAN7YRL3_9PEZI|nr:hypothetical protein LTR62_003759 [Meristemomyces frigidus]